MSVVAEIITIGDELLYGQTLDTNAHWISAKLDENNIRITRKTSIADNLEQILTALSEAEKRANIILITGGLGPTNDDLTKPCLAEYFGVELEMNESALHDVTELFSRVGRELTPVNEAQAMLPQGSVKLTNRFGTACGIWMERNDRVFIAMPGVPHEMKGIIENEALPRIKEKFLSKKIVHRIIRTAGVPESTLADLISEWENNLPAHIRLAYLPTLGQVKLRLTGEAEDRDILSQEIDLLIQDVLPKIEKHVYALENIQLEEQIGNVLRASNKTIACAESCTGGYLSHLLTTIPGSSDYFMGSCIAYSYGIKENILKVNKHDLETQGAVSETIVTQMAENVREIYGTDIGVGISGIAGPGGGTEDKPVGTVWMAVADQNSTKARKFVFAKDRLLNIKLTASVALTMIWKKLVSHAE